MQKIFFILSLCLLLPALVWAQGHHGHDGTAPRDHRWIRSLPEEQRAPAREILREALPEIGRLRHALREKVDALADLNYDEATPPETLLQLGRELQETRNALRERLARLEHDLREAIGTVPASLRRHSQRLRQLDVQGLAVTPAEVDKN